MKSPDGATVACWYKKTKIPKYRSPRGNLKADVCVVGAGIAGLTTAYLLAREAKAVIVVDEGMIGSGQTGRTSAHLSSAIDDRFVEIERMHGTPAARLAYQSHAAAIDAIERIVGQEKIDCDFVRLDGFLSPVPENPPDFLEREFAAAKRAGADVHKVRSGGLDNGPCLRFGAQARFHPLRYLIGLARAFEKSGGRIFTGRRIKDVQGADPKHNSPAIAQIEDGPDKVTAEHIVVATNTPSPINDWFGIYTKQAPYRSYVIEASIPRGAVADALYWDAADPYHYVRLGGSAGQGGDTIIIGGEDHKTGQLPLTTPPFGQLESWARSKFPMMGPVRCRWSGQVQEPADGLAFIGRALTDKQEVFVATGDSGMGLTHGTIAGLLITDLIAGRQNPWEKIYDPGRKIINQEFLKENVNTLAQYKDLVTGGEVKSVREIPPGEGAIIRKGLKKIAVYRDADRKLHRRSAVCTHLQCIVRWNPVEKSWDCPCHGSRFDPTGRVTMGPAVEDLAREGR